MSDKPIAFMLYVGEADNERCSKWEIGNRGWYCRSADPDLSWMIGRDAVSVKAALSAQLTPYRVVVGNVYTGAEIVSAVKDGALDPEMTVALDSVFAAFEGDVLKLTVFPG